MKKGIQKIKPVNPKKYTPPALIVYGKLSEITAAGISGSAENSTGKNPNMA
jgi:hypothetical protein